MFICRTNKRPSALLLMSLISLCLFFVSSVSRASTFIIVEPEPFACVQPQIYKDFYLTLDYADTPIIAEEESNAPDSAFSWSVDISPRCHIDVRYLLTPAGMKAQLTLANWEYGRGMVDVTVAIAIPDHPQVMVGPASQGIDLMSSDIWFSESPEEIYGFDDWTDRLLGEGTVYKSVTQSGIDAVVLNCYPETSWVHTATTNDQVATIDDPAAISRTFPKTLLLQGVGPGNTDLYSYDESVRLPGTLKTYVYDALPLKVGIRHIKLPGSATTFSLNQDIVNNIQHIWRQACVEIEVVELAEMTVAYDWLNEGGLTHSAFSEMGAITDAADDTDCDIVVFVVDPPDPYAPQLGWAFTFGPMQRFAFITHGADYEAAGWDSSAVVKIFSQTVAHELGHSQGLAHVTHDWQDPLNLMVHKPDSIWTWALSNRLRVAQWEQAHINQGD